MEEKKLNSDKKCKKRMGRGLWVLLIVGLVGIGLAFCGSQRDDYHGSPNKRAEWMVGKITSELDLNESQQQVLNKIKDEILAKREENKGIRDEIFNEIVAQVQKDKVDQTGLNQFFEQKEQHLKDMRKFFISKFAEFHAVLEPEQKTKLIAKMKEFREKHRKYHE